MGINTKPKQYLIIIKRNKMSNEYLNEIFRPFPNVPEFTGTSY